MSPKYKAQQKTILKICIYSSSNSTRHHITSSYIVHKVNIPKFCFFIFFLVKATTWSKKIPAILHRLTNYPHGGHTNVITHVVESFGECHGNNKPCWQPTSTTTTIHNHIVYFFFHSQPLPATPRGQTTKNPNQIKISSKPNPYSIRYSTESYEIIKK